MQIIHTAHLSEEQLHAVRFIAQTSAKSENLTLSCPEEADHYWLLEEKKSGILSFLAAYRMDEDVWECCAFTLPEYRRRGYFSVLLETACSEEALEECDLYFAADHRCPAALKTLTALGAEPAWEEYMMELAVDRAAADPAPSQHPYPLTLTDIPSFRKDIRETITVQAFLPSESDHPAGVCCLDLKGPEVYLYSLEIRKQLRGRGLGTAFLTALFPLLARKGYRTLSLQVSGENSAAMALYKKTGFRIRETLSYYLY